MLLQCLGLILEMQITQVLFCRAAVFSLAGLGKTTRKPLLLATNYKFAKCVFWLPKIDSPRDLLPATCSLAPRRASANSALAETLN